MNMNTRGSSRTLDEKGARLHLESCNFGIETLHIARVRAFVGRGHTCLPSIRRGGFVWMDFSGRTPIQLRTRLGGMLKYYYRTAA